MKALAVAIGWTLGTISLVVGGSFIIFIQIIRYIVGYIAGLLATIPFVEPPQAQPFEELYWISAAFVAGGFLMYAAAAWIIVRR